MLGDSSSSPLIYWHYENNEDENELSVDRDLDDMNLESQLRELLDEDNADLQKCGHIKYLTKDKKYRKLAGNTKVAEVFWNANATLRLCRSKSTSNNPQTPTTTIQPSVPVKAAPKIVNPIPQISEEKMDVMLSYNWNDQEKVKHVYKYLTDRGLKVWIDLNEMTFGKIDDFMMKGVFNSTVICCFISENYEVSPNCKKEIDYAVYLEKPLQPVRMVDIKDERKVMWRTLFYTSSLLWVRLWDVDVNSPSWNKTMEELHERILFGLAKNTHPVETVTANDPKTNEVLEISTQDEKSMFVNLIESFKPGTRDWLIFEIEDALQKENVSLVWLAGGAGLGKSTVSAEIARRELESQKICAWETCGSAGQNDPSQIIVSLANQIGFNNTQILASASQMSLKDLFRKAVIDYLELCNKKALFIIDGMDELDPTTFRRHEFLEAIISCCSESDRIRFLVSSREKANINSAFSKFVEINFLANDPRNIEDLNLYVRDFLRKLDPKLPQYDALNDVIVKKSQYNFTWVSYVMTMIAEKCDKITDFNAKLSCVNDFLDSVNPDLYAVYQSLLESSLQKSKEAGTQTETTKTILCMIVGLREEMSVDTLIEFLVAFEPSVDRNKTGKQFWSSVMSFHLLLNFVRVQTANQTFIALKHRTLSDYLSSPANPMGLDLQHFNLKFCICSLQFLIKSLQQDDYTDTLSHVDYSAKYWGVYLEFMDSRPLDAKSKSDVLAVFVEFLSKFVLKWITLLVKVKAFDKGIASLQAAKLWLNKNIEPARSTYSKEQNLARVSHVGQMFDEIVRFMLEFREPILKCVLWTDLNSALAFCPKTSLIRSLYFNPKSIPFEMLSGVPNDWKLSHAELETDFENNDVSLSEDGKLILVGGEKLLVVFTDNLQTLFETQRLPRNPVTAVQFSHCMKYLYAGYRNGEIKKFETRNGELLCRSTVHDEQINALALSPDGNTLSSGSNDRTLIRWNASTLQKTDIVLRLKLVSAWIRCIAFHPTDNATFACGSDVDSALRVWNNNDVKEPKILYFNKVDHSKPNHVRSVAFSPDGTKIAAGSEKGSIVIVNSDGISDIVLLREKHAGSVFGIRYSPIDNLLVSGGEDGFVFLWNVNSHALLKKLKVHTDHIKSIRFSPSGDLFFTASKDKTVRAFSVSACLNAESSQHSSIEEGGLQQNRVGSAAFSPDGNLLVCASTSRLSILETMTGARSQIDTTHKGAISSVAFSNDGKLIATGGQEKNRRLILWSSSGKLISEFSSINNSLRGASVKSLLFSADNTSIFAEYTDDTLISYSISTGKEASLKTKTEPNCHWQSELTLDGGWLSLKEFTKEDKALWIPLAGRPEGYHVILHIETKQIAVVGTLQNIYVLRPVL